MFVLFHVPCYYHTALIMSIKPRVGRPKLEIEINFADLLQNFEDIKQISRLDGMKEVLTKFADEIHAMFKDSTMNSSNSSSGHENSESATEIIQQVL